MSDLKELDKQLKQEQERNQTLQEEITSLKEYIENLTQSEQKNRSELKSENTLLNEKLVDAAYKEGLAESSIAILHNIGNTLTSILSQVSSDQLENELILVDSIIRKVGEVLQQEGQIDREKLIPLIQGIGDSVSKVANDLGGMFEDIERKCMHISEVISTQQSLANFKVKPGNFRLKKIVDDCILINESRIEKYNIALDINIDPLLEIYINRNGFTQVFSNLLVNAIESLEERFKSDPFLKEREIQIWNDSIQHKIVKVWIQDNGIGLSDDQSAKIFNFGFSTKKRGSGFGLHNCANLLKKNGGGIGLISEGLNKGAKVWITLPVGNSSL